MQVDWFVGALRVANPVVAADWFARVVALGSAVVACFALAWELFKYWKQRPCIDVVFKRRGVVVDDDFEYSSVSVRNCGGKAVSVESIAAESDMGEFYVGDAPILAPEPAAMFGIEGMFRRTAELPFFLQPGQTARWLIEIVSRSEVAAPADLTIVVTPSAGEIVRTPYRSEVDVRIAGEAGSRASRD